MATASPLVLLHPFPFDAEFWTPLGAVLPADRPVRTPEFPGFGGAPLEDGVTIDGVADRLAGEIAREPGGRAVVCGLSLGGYIALSLAARHPGRVAALVLADTRAEADDPAARNGRDAAIARVRSGDVSGFLDSLLPRLLAPHAPPDVVARARRIALRQPPEGVVAALAALRSRPDRRPDLPRIAVPTLVIWGREDRVTPEEAARALAAGIPGARLEVIPDAGHLTALERPEEFAAILAEFLGAAVPDG
jgi:pimeloyl-ACP methyl ester carboxylesterase